MSRSTSLLHCFPDTNTLIHFQTFDEVDWPTHLSAKAVELVLAPSVLRELDKHKNDPSDSRRSKRARMLNSKLKKLLESAPSSAAVDVRRGVTLSDIVRTPRIDWGERDLDQTDMDDRLIATVLEFREEHPNKPVVLVSNDFGVRRKAAAYGLVAVDPEEFITRYDFPSQDEQTIRHLTREVESLRRRLPDLRFGFLGKAGVTDRLTLPRPEPTLPWRTDEDIRKELDDEKDACMSELTPAHWTWVEEDCNAYIAAVERYIDSLEEFLQRERLLDAGFRLEVRLLLQNAGSAPATDVRASIFLPDEYRTCRSVDEDAPICGLRHLDRPSRPKPPEVPRLDQLSSALARSIMAGPTNVSIPYVPYIPPYSSPPPTDPRPETLASRTDISLSHPKLRAEEFYFADHVLVMMPPVTANGVQLTYHLHADELSEPIRGELHIRFSDH